MLDQDKLLDYVRKAKNGDEFAKSQIFNHNVPLIKSIVKRFCGKGVEYDDLFQIASIGFLKAIQNFDESFGVKFSTYSVPMVIGEIKRYMRDNGAIKVSRTIKILANKINRFIFEYQTQNCESPTIEFLAEKFNVSSEEVVVALDSSKMPLSIYEKFDDEDEGQELIDKIPSGETEDKLVEKIHLSNVIDALNEREKKIIIMRFFRDKTQGEVAESIGVSQVQISRLENKIIEKIRNKFNR
ncbi:MAG: SigB/SigF/SigG family RNA polymerase sigma factor [Clostridiales bacterium]|nr:SigB/SigF/SigG family RNA polymerase sigma factor [Clostridiales bacterium]